MIPILSRRQVRAFDRDAIEQRGIPGIVLMENAGRGAADAIERWLAGQRRMGLGGVAVVVAAGRGNNGGDGCVVARHLALRGADVTVFLTGERAELGGDAAIACAAWVGVGGVLVERASNEQLRAAIAAAGLVVDALYGTGLDRELVGDAAERVAILAASSAPVVALDLPSGIDADTGATRGAAVRAALTVTFAAPKPGLYATSALAHAGEVVVADIGAPVAGSRDLDAMGELVEAADVARLCPARPLAAHKGTSGRVVLVAGAPGTLGAARLAARGALRAGAGLVTLVGMPAVARQLDQRVIEVMTASLEPERAASSLRDVTAAAQAVAVGPGLGRSGNAAELVSSLVEGFSGPLVLDADALHLLGPDLARLRSGPGPRLLTPHPGELARLLEVTVAAVEADRFGAVARAVELTGAVVLLKGPRTLIAAPNAPIAVNSTGNPVLAVGGAGDVLTGIAVAFACRLPLREAAMAAAYVHGKAADRWSRRRRSDRGLLAREIADQLPAVFAELTAPRERMPS